MLNAVLLVSSDPGDFSARPVSLSTSYLLYNSFCDSVYLTNYSNLVASESPNDIWHFAELCADIGKYALCCITPIVR